MLCHNINDKITTLRLDPYGFPQVKKSVLGKAENETRQRGRRRKLMQSSRQDWAVSSQPVPSRISLYFVSLTNFINQ